MTTAERYREFADREVHRESPTYERLALMVAADPVLLRLLDGLPEPKRQPNLLFAAVRYLGGPVGQPGGFRDWVVEHWADVAATMRTRRTQTNEPGRCATLLPILARLPQPLALLEVGASAGLCLHPDVYRYRYRSPDGDLLAELPPDNARPGDTGPTGMPVLDCAVTGDVPLPERRPTVVWRAGLDLNPLDVADPDDLRWLDALIWPEHRHRRERLAAAADAVRGNSPPPRLGDPLVRRGAPLVRRGDLLADLPALAAQAPADATLVVFHTAVLCYVAPQTRARFAEVVRDLPGHWISNEAVGVFPDHARDVPVPADATPTPFLVALDGRPLALANPHGRYLRWLP